ncbi:MAG TPA: TonB-dependent receptor plug domain-containing protein, partial [Lacibacter sp.]|nr:TonB-dependent receptor plug domain-containing protein [Lacibacter sp.]
MTKTNLHKLLLTILLSGVVVCTQEVMAQQASVTKTDTTKAKAKLPLTGIVTDAATKKPLSGVRVAVKDFSAAITDDAGTFTLNVPSYTVDVEIVADGFAKKQVSLKGSKSITVALLSQPASTFQDEVTLPFGKVMKRNLTAAAVGYDANSEWRRPFEITDAALQGKVSGLNVIRRSGTPGIGANLFLRGYNSLYGTNSPLVVVDGIVYDINDYGSSIIANNYTNPLALINIQDIDNYTVVKDASSIYGVKGANGAIIITTSRAKEEATAIDFGVYTSYNQAPDLMPVMNANNYRI